MPRIEVGSNKFRLTWLSQSNNYVWCLRWRFSAPGKSRRVANWAINIILIIQKNKITFLVMLRNYVGMATSLTFQVSQQKLCLPIIASCQLRVCTIVIWVTVHFRSPTIYYIPRLSHQSDVLSASHQFAQNIYSNKKVVKRSIFPLWLLAHAFCDNVWYSSAFMPTCIPVGALSGIQADHEAGDGLWTPDSPSCAADCCTFLIRAVAWSGGRGRLPSKRHLHTEAATRQRATLCDLLLCWRTRTLLQSSTPLHRHCETWTTAVWYDESL